MNFRALLLLLMLALPIGVQAQFNYTTNDGGITITKYTGLGGNVIIPNTISGLPITRIGDSAFALQTSLTNVTIPDTVTVIEQLAFNQCFGLTSITLPGSVTTIAPLVFVYSGLTSINLPNGVTSIGNGAFQSCFSLTNAMIPEMGCGYGRAVPLMEMRPFVLRSP